MEEMHAPTGSPIGSPSTLSALTTLESLLDRLRSTGAASSQGRDGDQAPRERRRRISSSSSGSATRL
jgi:hypothetical protein